MKITRRKIIIGLISLVCIILLFPIGLVFKIRTFKISTESMSPTLFPGDLIIVDTSYFKKNIVKPNDLIVFSFDNSPSTFYSQRCIAVGGQVVQIINRVPFVDGKIAREYDLQYSNLVPIMPAGENEPGIYPNNAGNCDNYGPITVPARKYFVIGDNIAMAKDSRYYGFVDSLLIIGKPLFLYLSNDITRIGTQLY
jgi:signal peptidase I